mgnify:CR=1 FL=1
MVPPPPAKEAPPPLDAEWSALEWLDSLGLHEPLAHAILAPIAKLAPTGDARHALAPPDLFLLDDPSPGAWNADRGLLMDAW